LETVHYYIDELLPVKGAEDHAGRDPVV